jgi:serine/threonine protein kinase
MALPPKNLDAPKISADRWAEPSLSATETKPQKAIYSIANDKALLLVDRTRHSTDKTSFASVITLKVGADRYIKLRNIPVWDASEGRPNGDWIAVGSPPKFYLHNAELMEEQNKHDDPERYGPWGEICDAIAIFQAALTSDIQQVASQSVVEKIRLTTEMSPSRQLRAVEKKVLGMGTYKQVDEDTILYGGKGKIARAKVRTAPPEWNQPEKSLKEQKEYVASLRNEAALSKILYSVPHLGLVQASPGQNLKKIRLDMRLLEGGNFYSSLAMTPPVSTADRIKRIKYLSHIAQALEALHKAGYTYNDLKLENCLIDTEADEGVLGDLGSIRRANTPGGTGTYPAPECSSDKEGEAPLGPSTEENDCWAFGMLAYEMLHNSLHDRIDWRCSPKQISAASQKMVASLDLSDPADHLIANLISLDPRERPDMTKASQILDHLAHQPSVLVKKATSTYKKNTTHNFLTRRTQLWTNTKRPKPH